VALHHDTRSSGHPSRWKTLELVSRNYWWPGMSRFVAQFVRSCDPCNRTKIYPQTVQGKLLPNRIPNDRWEIVSTDLIVGLPSSLGFDSIWVAVDRLTKRARFAPTNKEVDSEGIARLFQDNVWKNHGLPKEVISDRGGQFVSEFMRELYRLLDTKITALTAYRPSTNGQTERINQEVKQYLQIFVNDRQDNWADWLALAEFSYNNRVSSSTRVTPFMADTGRNPQMGVEPNIETRVVGVEEFVTQMQALQVECQAALKQAANDMARFYD
jgi:hypothetical protein